MSSLTRSLLLIGCFSLTACAPGHLPTISALPATDRESRQMVEVINRIEQVNVELRTLRNTVEQTQYASTRQEQRIEAALLDFNRRLQALEAAQGVAQGVAPVAVVTPPAPPPAIPAPAGSAPILGSSVPQTPLQQPAPQAPISPAVPAPAAPAGPVPLAEQNRYDQAFALLKQSRYAEAVTEFERLLADSPASPLAADAHYWIGEVHYINREFAAAIERFQSIAEHYPGSDRVPEALLKIGYVQYDIGDYAAASATFQDLLARFPGHPTNLAAQTRLQRLQNTIQQ